MGRILMSTKLYSIQFEQSVLSILMDEAYNSRDFELSLKTEDFYATRHQEIFKAIEDLKIQDKKHSAELVLDHLKSKNVLDASGGEKYLVEICSNFIAYSMFSDYVFKLKKLTECRNVEQAGLKIVELAQNTLESDMSTKAQDIVASVENIEATDSRYSLMDSAVHALGVIDIKQQYKKDGSKQSYGVRTGLRDLDKLLGDVEPGHYMVIAAAPGGGKTTMAQMIALNAVKTNAVPCLFMSCEMEHHEVTNRIMSAQAKIPFSNIQSGNMEQEDYGAWIHQTANVFPDYKLDIVDKAGVSIQQIRGEIKKTIYKHGSIGCVIVDYIQLLSDHKAKDQFEKISNVSMGLKKIAKDFKVPVIALSQLTKEAIGRKISMSDLRGSGQIAQDADKIVLLSPDEKGVGLVVAEVAKNRQGQKGEARLVTKFDYCQFSNIKVDNY